MTIEDLQIAVLTFCDEHFPAAPYAVVVIHVEDGIPDATIPVPVSPPPPADV